jgi:hypothetical protein
MNYDGFALFSCEITAFQSGAAAGAPAASALVGRRRRDGQVERATGGWLFLHAIPRAGWVRAGAGPAAERGGHAHAGRGAVRAFTGFARIKKGWQWQWQRQRPAGDGEPRLGSPNLTRAHMEPAHSSAPVSYFIAAPAACAPSFNPL